MIAAILKNIFISCILFVSLYQFYSGLKKIGLQFKVGKCNLALHIFAFGMPVISGLIFLICIITFNQSSIFYSTRATKRYWYVLAPTLLYVIVGGINQMVMLYLIRNYSVRASNRNSQNLNQS